MSGGHAAALPLIVAVTQHPPNACQPLFLNVNAIASMKRGATLTYIWMIGTSLDHDCDWIIEESPDGIRELAEEAVCANWRLDQRLNASGGW